MPVSATDYITGVIAPPTSGQSLASAGNPGITWVLPYTTNGSGSQSFTNGSGTTTAASPTYTNPE